MKNKLGGLKFGCQGKSINLKTDQENIFKLKSKKVKRFMKTRQSLRDFFNSSRQSNIHVIAVSKGEERENEAKNIEKQQ